MSEALSHAQSPKKNCVSVLPDTGIPPVTFGTQALEHFLQVVGNGVSNLNTIAVGLAAIGKDHEKPDGLNISWAPKDPVLAACKARKSALHAAMVVTVEALGQYVRTITKLPRFEPLVTDWHSRKPSLSAAERFSELATRQFSAAGTAEYDKRFRTCCVLLLIHWRNRHVHTDSNAELTSKDKISIHGQAKHISTNYAGLDVDRLLGDFKTNRPTLKEATTLIAMTIQEVRAIDETVYICLDDADVHAWLDHYKLNGRIDIIRRETSAEKQHASILRMLSTHAPRLKQWYEKFIPEHPGP